MILSQVIDPATLLTGTNLTIAGIVIGLILLFKNKDSIAAWIKDKLAPTGTTPTLGAASGGVEFSLIDQVKKGLVTSDIARSASSILCRNMMQVADALPNKASAKKVSDSLRDAFVEFGVPTPADTTDPPVV